MILFTTIYKQIQFLKIQHLVDLSHICFQCMPYLLTCTTSILCNDRLQWYTGLILIIAAIVVYACNYFVFPSTIARYWVPVLVNTAPELTFCMKHRSEYCLFNSAPSDPVTQSNNTSQKPSLKEVMAAMKDIVHWENVAVQLEFTSTAIQKISQKPPEKQKLQMAMEWLGADETASMEKLKKAIKICSDDVLNVDKSQTKLENEDRDQMDSSNEFEIRDRFSNLVMTVGSALSETNTSVETIHQYLVQLLQCDIPKTDNFVDMLNAVTTRKLWDSLHYSPLEKLIYRFLPSQAVLMTEYRDVLSGFYTTTKLLDYIYSEKFSDVDDDEPKKLPLATYINEKKYYCKLTTTLKMGRKKISELSLKYVEDIWIKFVRNFDLPFLTALLHHIATGSLEIVLLILPHVAELIIKSAHKSLPFFRENDIVYVAIDDHPIYDASLTVSNQKYSFCMQS